MAASDARPVPRKNAAWRVYFAIRKSDGTLITSWTGADSEVSKDGGSFADCTDEATEVGTSGCGYLDLSASEMNADAVTIKITVTNTGALPLVLTVFPEEAGDYRIDTTNIDAIKAKTDNLPSDPADASDIASSFTTVNATLATIAGYIDTEVAAIKAKTDNLPTDPADQSAVEAAITAAIATLPTAAENADAVWDEPFADHTGSTTYGGRIVRATNSNVTVQITGSNHIAADVHAFQTDVIDATAIASSAVTKIQSGLATLANQTTILDRQAYTLAVLAGACSDPQTASETYVLTIGGSTYTVDMAGQTSTGTRTAPTLTKT